MISADDFLKENYQKQGKGKLLKFKNDILKLRNAGLSSSKICEFLNQNKISVSEEAVRRFCKKHAEDYEKDSKVIVQNKKTEQMPIAAKKVEQPDKVKTNSDYVPPSWSPKDLNIKDLI